MKNDSYIKTHNPDMYAFFLDFWELISKFWVIDTDNEYYYNCLTSEMLYYTRKYERNFFYSNFLFAVYDHCYSEVEECMTLDQLRTYLSDLWTYINATYEMKENKKDEAVSSLTKKIKEKYKDKEFCQKLIDHYLSWKFPELETAA